MENVVYAKPIMLSVIMLDAVMLSAIMLCRGALSWYTQNYLWTSYDPDYSCGTITLVRYLVAKSHQHLEWL
jgi:hypothetical protein